MTARAPGTSGRRVLLTPGRDDLIDAGFLAALVVLALLGFRTTYSGSGYLIAGVCGLVLGLLVAHLANALSQPLIALAAMSIAAFFLLGGAIALRADTIAGIIPSGGTFRGLAESAIHGWKQLLTTLPPVDGTGPLLVLPYFIALIAGAGGLCLARRVRRTFPPLVAPFATLVAVILLGTQTPAAQVIQGALFAVVALAWAAVRFARTKPVVKMGSGRVSRMATGLALLGIAGAGAWALGPDVPGAGAHSRTVLRSYVTPPFDVGQYPSPLAGFRAYTRPQHDLFDKTLFTVSGLPRGSSIRIATLDDYDAATWRASNHPSAPGLPAATFQRVGSTIATPARGAAATITVTIQDYSNVWLPDVGATSGISFAGTHASDHADNFRYNLATDTGIVPDGLSTGDRYTLHAIVDNRSLQGRDAVAQSGALPDEDTSFLMSFANKWAGSSTSQTARVLHLASTLRRIGKYSDGGPHEGIYLPGHSVWRLNRFVNGVGDTQIVGDDEQYAATLALLINQIGTPARVVLGATPKTDVVKGSDVHAWVEVQLGDGTWRQIPTDEFMDSDRPPTDQPPQQQPNSSGKIVPPPARVRPHSSVDDAAAAASRSSHRTPTRPPPPNEADGSWSLPAWVTTTAKWGGPPTLAIVVVLSAIVALKTVRRRRRRSRGSAAVRVGYGWRELIDHARDLGSAVPAGHTRREQAVLLAQHDLTDLARAADGRVFGPIDPEDAAALEYWRRVDAARKDMSRSVGRWRRIRATFSLASLRRPAPASGAAT